MNARDVGPGGAEPPFRRLAIVGLGLIGGSIALAARRRWPDLPIAGVDRPEVLSAAISAGALTDAFADAGWARALAGADLVVLATPVGDIVDRLARLAPLAAPGAVVTDVGSTKRAIVAAASGLTDGGTFIGGHPLAGAAAAGFESARPELFDGRTWLLTPGADCLPGALERLRRFIAGIGARPSLVEAGEHDRLMAALSHLPQIAASALMRVAGELAGEPGLEFAGPGLRDTTRLAASPAGMWADICATNDDRLGEALDRYITVLGAIRARLSDRAAIDQTFGLAREWRSKLDAVPAAGGSANACVAAAGSASASPAPEAPATGGPARRIGSEGGE